MKEWPCTNQTTADTQQELIAFRNDVSKHSYLRNTRQGISDNKTMK